MEQSTAPEIEQSLLRGGSKHDQALFLEHSDNTSYTPNGLHHVGQLGQTQREAQREGRSGLGVSGAGERGRGGWGGGSRSGGWAEVAEEAWLEWGWWSREWLPQICGACVLVWPLLVRSLPALLVYGSTLADT